MQANAPAKINLYLAVVDKRRDGYHDIESLFVPLPGLYDTIDVGPVSRPGLSIACDSEDVPCDSRNLAWRAAESFALTSGVEASWEIFLKKRIPVAAGLGGGSSDAATVLKILDRLYPGKVSAEALRKMAAKLGADVPFFLEKGPCTATGIGEILTPCHGRESIPLLLVNPGFPVSAGWAYNQTEPGPGLGFDSLMKAFKAGELSAIAAATFNAFEEVETKKFPLLQLLREALLECGALCARLSGSGPTLFAIMKDLTETDMIKAHLRDRFGEQLWLWSGWSG